MDCSGTAIGGFSIASSGLCVCPYASTLRVYYRRLLVGLKSEGVSSPHFSSSSRLFWLSGSPWIATCVLGAACQFLQRSHLDSDFFKGYLLFLFLTTTAAQTAENLEDKNQTEGSGHFLLFVSLQALSSVYVAFPAQNWGSFQS